MHSLMKFLKSPWLGSILGGVLYLVVTMASLKDVAASETAKRASDTTGVLHVHEAV